MKIFPRTGSPLRATGGTIAELRGRIRRLEQAEPGAAAGPAPVPFTLRDERRADEAVPFALRVSAGVAWRVIVIAVALYGVGRILGATRSVVIPVGVALLLAALLLPVTVFLNHRLRFPRTLAALTTLMGGLGLVVGLLYLAGNQVVSGMVDLSDSVSQGLNQIQGWLTGGPLQMGGDQISDLITQARTWVENNAGSLTSGAVAAGTTAGNLAVGTIMALFACFFFLSDGDRMWAWSVRLAPEEIRRPIHEAGRRGWVTLSSFVKTQVVVAAVDAVFIALGALLLGLPLVVPLGLIVFFAAAIPVVGAVASGALAVLLALVVKGPVAALIMLGVVLAVQQIEGNVLQPVLMSKAVSLHPLATILGVAAGSYLFGIAGALFAVPLMAVTNTVMLYLNGHDKFPMLGHDASLLTNSAKELSGDKHAPDDAGDPPTPGGSDTRLGDVTPESAAADQAAADAHAERIAHQQGVTEDGQVVETGHPAADGPPRA